MEWVETGLAGNHPPVGVEGSSSCCHAHCSAKPSHDIGIENCLSNSLDIGSDFRIFDVFNPMFKMKIYPKIPFKKKMY